MKPYAYLLIDFFTILVPFAYSFHPKLRFDRRWKAFWPSMIIAGLIFLIWDEYFTRIGVWGFNPDYLIGVSLWHLPIEEVLFFVCIPYACVFTYHCLKELNINTIPGRFSSTISALLVGMLSILLVLNFGKYYTTTTFTLVILTISYLQWLKKTDLTPFYFAYLLLLIPFGITNGILTGSFIEGEIVWYNDAENMSFRLGTIPFEDIFYGMLLILWNVALMEFLDKKFQSKSSSIG